MYKKIVDVLVSLKSMRQYSLLSIIYFVIKGVNLATPFKNDYVINRYNEELVGKTGQFDFGDSIYNHNYSNIEVLEFRDLFDTEFCKDKIYFVDFKDVKEFYSYAKFEPPGAVNLCYTLNGLIRKTHFLKSPVGKELNDQIATKYDELFNVGLEKIITIATACYNNELYLEQYFTSITRQPNFHLDIKIVIVNDGSTDKSHSIMKQWEQKFPNNIVVIDQPNMGQAAARNTALSYVDTKWVTFIDSDDFISEGYFLPMLSAMKKTPNCMIFTGNITNYNCDTDTYSSIHPTNVYGGKEMYNIINFEKAPRSCRLSVSVTLLNVEIIKNNRLVFRTIQPAFEDTDFMINYYCLVEKKEICYCKDAIYYYRKSNSHISTTTNILHNPNYYDSFINEGILKSIDKVESTYKVIPRYVQVIYLEVTQWILRAHFNKEAEFNYILDDVHKEKTMDFYKLLYSKINNNLHNEFFAKTFSIQQNVGINNILFGQEHEKASKVEFLKKADDKYVFAIHTNSSNIEIRDFNHDSTSKNKDMAFFENRLFGSSFIKSYYYYSKSHPSMLKFYIDGFELEPIMHRNLYLYNTKKNKNILIMDRMDLAGDNGEVLYDHLRKGDYNITSLLFSIRKDSKDWDRLVEKGFNLVEYGSGEFIDAYCNSDWVISSHVDMYISDFSKVRTCNPNIKFLFLQHGINMGNVDCWLSARKFDKIITTGIEETKQLSHLFANEVVETGLPRFDRKLEQGRDILYMPGWSVYLNTLSDKEFEKSQKYLDIYTIMNSAKLKKHLEDNDQKILVKLHPNLAKKFDFSSFNSNSIKVTELDYEEAYSSTNLIITDFSSSFVDKFVKGSNVMFLQTSPEEYYRMQIVQQRDNFSKYGPIFRERNLFIDAIIDENLVDWEKYDKFRANNFQHIEYGKCSEKIAIEILEVGDHH